MVIIIIARRTGRGPSNEPYDTAIPLQKRRASETPAWWWRNKLERDLGLIHILHSVLAGVQITGFNSKHLWGKMLVLLQATIYFSDLALQC